MVQSLLINTLRVTQTLISLIINQTDDEYAKKETEIADTILPNYRYYGGQVGVDRIERLAIARACRLFMLTMLTFSRTPELTPMRRFYYAWCEPGNKILAGHQMWRPPYARLTVHSFGPHLGLCARHYS